MHMTLFRGSWVWAKTQAKSLRIPRPTPAVAAKASRLGGVLVHMNLAKGPAAGMDCEAAIVVPPKFLGGMAAAM